jgi:hypothetical protein
LDDRPFEIAQFVAARDHEDTSGHLESLRAASNQHLL